MYSQDGGIWYSAWLITSVLVSILARHDNLKDAPCTECGVHYPKEPYVMDFHHVGKEKKECSIGNAVSKAWSLERIQVELNKCRLVCALCHRRITHMERVGQRGKPLAS